MTTKQTTDAELAVYTVGELKPTWRHVQNYADAKTSIVEEILARTGGTF